MTTHARSTSEIFRSTTPPKDPSPFLLFVASYDRLSWRINLTMQYQLTVRMRKWSLRESGSAFPIIISVVAGVMQLLGVTSRSSIQSRLGVAFPLS